MDQGLRKKLSRVGGTANAEAIQDLAEHHAKFDQPDETPANDPTPQMLENAAVLLSVAPADAREFISDEVAKFSAAGRRTLDEIMNLSLQSGVKGLLRWHATACEHAVNTLSDADFARFDAMMERLKLFE